MAINKNINVPNSLTLSRALGIPLFIYLALGPQADGWAILTLAIGGATDYFDGKIARAWGQESRFGELADPAIDRLYILATLIVLYMRDALPLWMIALLLGRDLILAVLTLALTLNSLPPLKVTYLGKAATFNLLYAFPFLLLALADNWAGTLAYIFGWSFAIWGVGLYLFTGVSYFQSGVRAIRVER
jgi:cardiolipin synthase